MHGSQIKIDCADGAFIEGHEAIDSSSIFIRGIKKFFFLILGVRCLRVF